MIGSGEFDALMTFGTRGTKKLDSPDAPAVFQSYTVGLLTARDEVVYGFDRNTLADRIERFIEVYNVYNGEVDRLHRTRTKQKRSGVIAPLIHQNSIHLGLRQDIF
jgi:predicted helicase